MKGREGHSKGSEIRYFWEFALWRTFTVDVHKKEGGGGDVFFNHYLLTERIIGLTGTSKPGKALPALKDRLYSGF